LASMLQQQCSSCAAAAQPGRSTCLVHVDAGIMY
jgi:ribosomal protein L24E